MGLDPARPSPRTQNNSLNFVVRLKGKRCVGRDTTSPWCRCRARCHAWCGFLHWRQEAFTGAAVEHRVRVLTLMFPGMEVHIKQSVPRDAQQRSARRRGRNHDLRRVLEGELAHRRYGRPKRLETSTDCPDDSRRIPAAALLAGAPGSLSSASDRSTSTGCRAIYELVLRNDLKYPPFAPALPPSALAADQFELLRTRDSCCSTPSTASHR